MCDKGAEGESMTDARLRLRLFCESLRQKDRDGKAMRLLTRAAAFLLFFFEIPAYA
jgi:hypothetical protein